MAMFDDPKKELQRLQEQLLQEEEWFARELGEAKMMIGQAPAKQAKKPTARPTAAPRTTASRTSAAASQPPAAAPKTNPKVRNYANGYGTAEAPAPTTRVRNTDARSEKAPAKKKKGIKGLVILALLETAGIVGIVAYWLLVLL